MLVIPAGFRPSTLREREVFYRDAFDARAAWDWVSRIFPSPVFAVNLGKKTGIVKRGADISKGYMVFFRAGSPEELRRKVIKYAPEGVYYWRNRVSDYDKCKHCPVRNNRRVWGCGYCGNLLSQELVFDLDPENVEGKVAGSWTSFTWTGFKKIRALTLSLVERLEETYTKIHIFYSGRGFHVHVLDEDLFYLEPRERETLAREYARYGVERVVTAGPAALIRLPHSLNGVVNKETVPVTKKELPAFDPRF